MILIMWHQIVKLYIVKQTALTSICIIEYECSGILFKHLHFIQNTLNCLIFINIILITAQTAYPFEQRQINCCECTVAIGKRFIIPKVLLK